ncbi:MAG: hypothetical protein RL660_1471 [Bacteroidota bacterium]|jgi:thiol-disulfide isomerase/thioredoxin
MKKVLITLACAASITTAVAQTTVRKVVLEDFTGTWCGWCPEGTVVLEGLKTQYPTTFYPVASHNGDALEVPAGAAIDNGIGVTGYPNGAIDRYKYTGNSKISMSRGQWASKTSTRFNMAAIASVSLTDLATDGTNFTGKINAKFSTAPNGTMPINVQLYILEDSIPATGNLLQSNYSSSVQGGADPLTNWFHNETLRKAAGPNWGWTGVIPNAAVVGTNYTKDFSFTVPAAWVKKNVHVLAFIAYDGDTSVNGKEILNADGAPLSSFFPTGLGDNSQTLTASVYPNPTNAFTNVGFTFNLSSDANVRLEVLDVAGKRMGNVYESYEIAGVHTMKWSPASVAGLPTGMYFAHITASNGQQGVFKFSVQ